MQSFLHILHFYSRFIEDFAGYASVLYELSKANFHKFRRMEKMETPTRNKIGCKIESVKGIEIQVVSVLHGAIQYLTNEKVMAVVIQVVSV